MSRPNYGKKQHWRQQLPELAELAAWERPTVATPEDILIEREEAEQLYRAMERLPARLRQRHGMSWIGPHGHVVTYPLRRGELLNFVTAIR